MGELTPATEDEVRDAVRDAAGRREPIAVEGGGTRSGWGRPVQAAHTLRTGGLTGITSYEPSEMVMSARAGTPLPEIEQALTENRQRLLFEPMDHRSLYRAGREPTIGGVFASNSSGPRRFVAGAARDALLGVRFVNGRGEAVKGGGRVMKNVTGLDLPKVMAGSWGTLGVVTEVTFKVAPVAETQATLRFEGLDREDAVALLAAVMATPCEPTGAAVLADGATCIRVEGLEQSVATRAERIAKQFADHGAPKVLRDEASDDLWRAVRDVEDLAGGESDVWRLSVAPSDAPAIVGALGGKALLDWQGGLVWLATDAAADAVRQEVTVQGGTAILARASLARRAVEHVFHPKPHGLAALEGRVRAAFDPHGVFNPGRMS